MYRGDEMILLGRHPEDALATTARLCGICTTSHVVAATDALENAWNIVPPAQAVRLRNLFLAAESLMSDARQGALFFGPGLCHPSFAGHPLYDEIVKAFQPPFVGWLPRQVIAFSKRILGVITAFTQQWPHSIPFRPGGTSCPVGKAEIQQAEPALDDDTTWYAPTILGGSLDDWALVTTAEQFREWVDRRPHSVIGLYTRYATEAAGLHLVGLGSDNLLSGGLYRHATSRPGHRSPAGSSRRPPHRVRPSAGPGAQPVLLVCGRRPTASRTGRRDSRPQSTRVLQLGHRNALRTRRPGDATRSPGRAPHCRRLAYDQPRRRGWHQRLSAPARPLDVWRRHAHADAVVRRAGTCTRRSSPRAPGAGRHRSRLRRLRSHQRHPRHLDALGHTARRQDHHLPGDHSHHVEREPS